jgi:hypothetical protein
VTSEEAIENAEALLKLATMIVVANRLFCTDLVDDLQHRTEDNDSIMIAFLTILLWLLTSSVDDGVFSKKDNMYRPHGPKV